MESQRQLLEVVGVKRRRGKTEVTVDGYESQIVPDIVLMRHCLRELRLV